MSRKDTTFFLKRQVYVIGNQMIKICKNSVFLCFFAYIIGNLHLKGDFYKFDVLM